MLGNLQGWHLLIILVVVLLLFGAPRLPALARSVGQSMRILKHEVRDEGSEPATPANTRPPDPPA
jgi:sec-independent protein translocase protein TatA